MSDMNGKAIAAALAAGQRGEARQSTGASVEAPPRRAGGLR
ncbi:MULTISPECIES: hypothetical protein [Sorangium]